MDDGYINRPVGRAELEDLSALATKEEEEFFLRNPHLVSAYHDRLIAVALCQGSALQYLERGYGVKDFDVHFFYFQNPSKPRLSRSIKRTRSTIGAFVDFPVDFIRSVIPGSVEVRGRHGAGHLVQQFLRDQRTANARYLSKGAVVAISHRLYSGLFFGTKNSFVPEVL